MKPQDALEVFRPKREGGAKLTKFYPKDGIFNKTKTYIDKKRPFEEQNANADWRNLSIGGKKIVLIKGQALAEDELEAFNDQAKEYWLHEQKRAKKSDGLDLE